MLIGHLKAIVRYPVKSFHGESVHKTKITKNGLYGDRSHAFLDESRPGKYLTTTQFPEMAQYKARLKNADDEPHVEVTTPDGRIIAWNDAALIGEMEQKAKRKVTQIAYSPENVPLGAIEEENILLVTDASLHKMAEIWGKKHLNFKRFRPNFVISLLDEIPFIEEQWFGRTMQIGQHVQIKLIRHCERCMIITVDPDTGDRDPSLHKTVIKERNNHFGVYASVVKTGEIKSGDEIYLQK